MKFASVLGLVAVAVGLSPIYPDTPVRSAGGHAAGVQDIPPGAPVFELDPSWPAVPEQWVLGEVSSIGIGDGRRILLLHRPRSAPPAERSRAAPPVLEFDIAGNFLDAWGGAGAGYEWPEREHGIHVDHEGSVWIGGNYCPERDLPGLEPVSDDQLLKFSRSGEFLLQIGRSDGSAGSGDIRNVRQPGDQAVYPPTNEVFVADGYGNRRMVVFDAETGEFRRMWGAFGSDPADSYECPPSLDPPFRGATKVRPNSTSCTPSRSPATGWSTWRTGSSPGSRSSISTEGSSNRCSCPTMRDPGTWPSPPIRRRSSCMSRREAGRS